VHTGVLVFDVSHTPPPSDESHTVQDTPCTTRGDLSCPELVPRRCTAVVEGMLGLRFPSVTKGEP